jgi:hypothetical protein
MNKFSFCEKKQIFVGKLTYGARSPCYGAGAVETQAPKGPMREIRTGSRKGIPMTTTRRPLLALAVLAAAAATAPAAAGGIEAAAPVQAVTHGFGAEFGDRTVLAYYTRGAGTCDAVLMTHREPGPRVRVSLTPDQAATIEDVGGGALKLTCGAGAARMLVERTPAPLNAASAR